MNETMKTLLERRSVRSFEARQIRDEELEQLVQAALWAPSGMNRQPWKLVVTQGGTRDRVAAAAEPFPNRGGNPFYGAPTIFLVFTDRKASTAVQDGSLMLGNLMLAAASLGLGSCWINCMKDVFATPEGRALKEELVPDENYTVVGSLAVGYAKEAPPPKDRREDTVLYFH